jgi:K+-sensing histidine kinase KdpD
MGIPAAQLESIFDPFFTTKETGTGFGLAIVHRVIQDNEGTISASSTPGKGSRFKITFPRPTSSERSDVRALKLAASHPSLGSDDPMPRSKRHGGADRQVE